MAERHDERAAVGLAPSAPLGLAAHAIELREITDRALVTVVTADAAVRARLERAFGVAVPAVGASVTTSRGERLLGLQTDRLYVLFDADGVDDAEHALRERVERAGATDSELARDDTPLYVNDQSDAWVMLRLDGAASRRALERVCPLDLHPDVYPVGALARSVVEHLGVIVLREGDDAFLLLSPRSSARSFLHEIETSIRHVGDLHST